MNVTSSMTREESSDTLQPATTYHPYYKSMVERQVVAALVGIVAVIGFCGNSLVILAVVLSRKLRTFTNVFVVNLALADLSTCTCLPWIAIAIVSEDGWELPDWICTVNGFWIIVCLGSSINTLACIAINRYVLITKKPSTYSGLYTPWKIAVMVTITWTLPILISIVPLVSEVGEFGNNHQFSTCTWDSQAPGADLFALIVAIAYYPIQLLTIIFCYLSIYLHIRKHVKKMKASMELSSISANISHTPQQSETTSPQEHRQHRNKRIRRRQIDVTKNLFYIVCGFLIFITPYVIVNVSHTDSHIFIYTAVLLLCNSCVNFFVYAAKHSDFKKVFKCIFTCNVESIPERVFCRWNEYKLMFIKDLNKSTKKNTCIPLHWQTLFRKWPMKTMVKMLTKLIII